jgi:hypothetical protein
MDFDLSGLRDADQALKRTSFYVVLSTALGLGVVLVGTEAWGIHFVLSSGLSTSQDQGLVFGGAMVAFTAGFLALTLPSFLPGAEAVRVDQEGIHLFFRGGRSRVYRWTDPHSRFCLKDYSAYPSVTRQGFSFVLSGARFWNGRSLLTENAYRTVLEEGRARRLVEREYKGSSQWYPHPPRIYQIQGRRA